MNTAAKKAVHECLFCPHTFETATAKDEHILEHFAQETCLECNRDLIRIGCSLYVKHDPSICSIRAPKIEAHIEPPVVETFTTQNYTATDLSESKHAECVESDPTATTSSIGLTQDNSHCVENDEFIDTTVESMKTEQQNMTEDSNGSIDFDLLDRLDDQTAASECDDAQSITSDIEFKLQTMLCKEEIQIDSEQIEPTIQSTKDRTNAEDPEKKLKCEICEKDFAQLQSLRKHSILKHSSPDTIFCHNCARIFSTIEDLDRHQSNGANKGCRKSKEGKIYLDLQCDICDVKLDSELAYRYHMVNEHSRRIRAAKCKYCGDSFLEKSWLQEHRCPIKVTKMREMSQMPRKQRGSGEVQCKICFSKLQSEQTLRGHMQRKHSTVEKFKCSLCKAIFMKKSSLEGHNCPVKSYTCNICGKELQRLITFKMHQVRYHSAPGVIFCDICTRVFATADERDMHRSDCAMRRRFPGSYAKFECYMCKKQMRRKGNVVSHMRRKHESVEDQFKCLVCGHIFMHESSLKKHLNKCKGRQKPTPTADDNERITCEFCGKILSKFSIYAHRTAYHSEPGTIFCRVCYKVFPTVNEHNLHQAKCRKKRNTKRSCEICGLVLASSRTLVRHKISLHSDPGTIIFCRTCVKKFKTVEELNAHKPECTLKRKLNKTKAIE